LFLQDNLNASAIKLNRNWRFQNGGSLGMNDFEWNPLIWIVGLNTLERIQISGLDVKASTGKRGFPRDV
jgi:hypothetical protein